MNADDLRLEEIVDFSEGMVSLRGRRLVLHSIHAFAQFRKDIVDMLGLDEARRLFTRFGNFWGQADAAAMKRIFRWDSLSEWLKAGPRFHSLQGAARAQIAAFDLDETTRRLRMEIVWHQSAEAEEHLAELGEATMPVCWILSGYMSGYASYCLGSEVYFVETACRARGDRVCRAAGGSREIWGTEIEAHRRYFHAPEIHNKIQELTRELKRKDRELQKQRRRLEVFESGPQAVFQEVRSPAFRRVLDLVVRIAPYDTSVLI
ncbi:MAG: XylR N-terminal domain-containing protein, partial [Planctomycetota bacterium]|nr:XylR N-terminal domain-containing protein [Planctomycetota bacterium]